MSDQAVLEGLISVQAALHSESREIHAIYIQRDRRQRSIARLEQRARSAGIRVRRVDNDTIAAHASGRSHGGVIALVGPRRFVRLEDLIPGTDLPFIVMLDGIEDPFNFGAAVRALYAAGADGLVVRPRNWMSAAGIVARSPAGATERRPTAVAETAPDAASIFRERGLAVGCAIKRRAVSIYEADLAIPLFLVNGGEKRGITRSFVDRADLRLRIPYQRRFPQLWARPLPLPFSPLRSCASGSTPEVMSDLPTPHRPRASGWEGRNALTHSGRDLCIWCDARDDHQPRVLRTTPTERRFVRLGAGL